MSDVNRISFEPPKRKSELRAKGGKAATKKQKPLKERIPTLPPLDVDPAKIVKPDQRSVACVNMRMAGAPFHEIAVELGYSDASQAKQQYINALANMFPIEDWETLRQIEAMRAETQLRRSFAMAGAEYLVDHETGEKIPNTDRLRWHEQAGKDLALHAMITGAKAPARLEVSASTQELNQMVQVLLQANGDTPEIEADVYDIDDLPDEANPMEE